MEKELIAIIGALALALGYVVKWVFVYVDEKGIAKRRNGRSYVTSDQLREYCEQRMSVINSQNETICRSLTEQRNELRELSKAIYAWKDETVEAMADHRARIGALERKSC